MTTKHPSSPQRLRDLPGLGIKSESMLAQVGIHDVSSLMQADAFELYARLKATVPGVSLNALYALIGAQEGVHWQTIARERKTAILLRLDDMGLAP